MHCMPPNVSTPIAWPWIVRIHCYPHNDCYLCQDRGVSIYPCTNSRIISCFPCDFGHCILFSLHILGFDRYVYNSPFSWCATFITEYLLFLFYGIGTAFTKSWSLFPGPAIAWGTHSCSSPSYFWAASRSSPSLIPGRFFGGTVSVESSLVLHLMTTRAQFASHENSTRTPRSSG